MWPTRQISIVNVTFKTKKVLHSALAPSPVMHLFLKLRLYNFLVLAFIQKKILGPSSMAFRIHLINHSVILGLMKNVKHH